MVVDIVIVGAILLMAIFLFILEIFVLPGITFAALGGIVCAIAGVAYAYYTYGVVGGVIALSAGAALFGVTLYATIKSNLFDRMALEKQIDSKVVTEGISTVTPGEIGLTLSRLNPMGKVNINGLIFEAKSVNGFVDEQQSIRVLKVVDNTVLVETC